MLAERRGIGNGGDGQADGGHSVMLRAMMGEKKIL